MTASVVFCESKTPAQEYQAAASMQSSSLLTEALEPIVMGVVWDSRSCNSSLTIIRARSFWRTSRQSEEAVSAQQSRFRPCNNAIDSGNRPFCPTQKETFADSVVHE